MNCRLALPGIDRRKIAANVQNILDNAHKSRSAYNAAMKGTPVNEILAAAITESVLSEINLSALVASLRQLVKARPGSGDYHAAVREGRAALEQANL